MVGEASPRARPSGFWKGAPVRLARAEADGSSRPAWPPVRFVVMENYQSVHEGQRKPGPHTEQLRVGPRNLGEEPGVACPGDQCSRPGGHCPAV